MKNILLISILVILFPLIVISQNFEREVINHLVNYEKVPLKLFENDDTLLYALNIIRNYTMHPDEMIRRRSYRLTSDIGFRSKSSEVKSLVLEILIDATLDSKISIRESVSRTFSLFSKDLYTQDFKNKLKNIMRIDNAITSTHVLLVGFLDMSEFEDQLLRISQDTSNYSNNIKSGKSYFKSIGFSAHLAMARMGRKESIDFAIASFEKSDLWSLVVRYLYLVAYIKQREAVDLLVQLLKTEEEIGGGDVILETYGSRTLNYLIPMFEEFPVKGCKPICIYNNKQVEIARQIMNGDGKLNLKINKDVW